MHSSQELIRIKSIPLSLGLMLVMGFIHTLMGQGLCQTSTGFRILEGNTGCEPFRVTLENQMTGATNVKYIFYYNGEGDGSLSGLNPTTDLSNTYFTLRNESSSKFTILQFGKDAAGKDFYSCQTIHVKKGIKPQYSYTICSSGVEVVIPKNEVNANFDSFVITVGSQNKTISRTDLPQSLVFTTTYPSQLTILGETKGEDALDCNKVTETLIKRDPLLYPNGYEVPFDINIDTLELVEKNRARLTINGSMDEAGYTLQMREANGDYPSIALKEGIKTGNLEIDLPNPDLSYCFKLTRRAGCGSYEFSAELCTMPITQSDIDEWGEIQIRWLNHVAPSTDQTFAQSKKITISRVNKVVETKGLSLTNNSYKDFMECGVNKICYQLENNVSGKYMDYKYAGRILSNEVCLTADNLKATSIKDFSVSVNDTKEVEFFLSPPDNPLNPISMYKLFLINEANTTTLDSSKTPEFVNRSLDTDNQSYCFFTQYQDDCKRISVPSDTVCSLFLSEYGEADLIWTEQSPFSSEKIAQYEVEVRNELSGLFEIHSPPLSGQVFKPNLELFENQAEFRVKAISQNGLLSYSNRIELPLQFNLYIPSAFSPNNDTFNDLFRIFTRFDQVEDFFFQLYDRNGNIVFESREANFSWDGKMGSTFVSSGLYSYQVYCQNKKQEVIKKQGTLLLLK